VSREGREEIRLRNLRGLRAKETATDYPITPMLATSLHWPTRIWQNLRRQSFPMRQMIAVPTAQRFIANVLEKILQHWRLKQFGSFKTYKPSSKPDNIFLGKERRT